MSRVEKIAAVSAISPSAATEICFTTSITSDPENTWIAHRQSTITAALDRRKWAQGKEVNGRFSEPHPEGAHLSQSHEVAASREKDPPKRLSGENERIGQGDWAESTPFGKRVSYL